MKPVYKLILTGCLAITLFDVLGSILSKQLNFNYAYLFFVPFFRYVFAQLLHFVDRYEFGKCVSKYNGDSGRGISIVGISPFNSLLGNLYTDVNNQKQYSITKLL